MYGTSTRAAGPGATVDLQGEMRTASSSVVGSQNTGGSTSGSQPYDQGSSEICAMDTCTIG